MMKKHVKKERESKQQSTTLTYCCKFIENYQNETSKLLELNYEKLYEKFKKLYNDALETLNDGNAKTEALAKKLCKPSEQELSSANIEQQQQQQEQQQVEQKQARKRRLSDDSIIECDKPKRQAKNKANAKISKQQKSKKQESIETSDTRSSQQQQPKTNKPQHIEPQTPHQNKLTEASLYQIESTIKRNKVQEIADKFEEKIRLNSCQRPQPPSTIKKIDNPTIKRALRFNNRQQQQPSTSTLSTVIANAGIRTSIDNRKIRTSLAKCETKQKSIKKLNAFVKTLQACEQTPSTSTTINNNNNNTNNVNNNKQQTSNETVAPSQNSDTKRITTNQLLSSTFIQQQFKVSSKTNNPNSKYPDKKASFAKFLERNTPVKCTKTELEEKRKAELMTKEKREQERLHEIEKEKLEKIEIAKKKREERMRKINESKAKRKEDEQKRKEEIEQKGREIEEKKTKILEEKKREREIERLKQTEEKRILSTTVSSTTSSTTITTAAAGPSSSSNTSSILYNPVVVLNPLKLNNYQKNQLLPPLPVPAPSSTASSSSSVLINKPLAAKQAHQTITNKPPLKQLETTYVLNTPAVEVVQNKIALNAAKENLAGKVLNNSAYNHYLSPSKGQSYPVTPLTEQVYKLKDENNYDVSQLCSEDETDDEDEPRKPIPQWAKDPNILRYAKQQTIRFVNYTKIFKSASNCDIKLEQIFRTKRKKFTERSSSAIWNTPPVWNSAGISGNESFRALK